MKINSLVHLIRMESVLLFSMFSFASELDYSGSVKSVLSNIGIIIKNEIERKLL